METKEITLDVVLKKDFMRIAEILLRKVLSEDMNLIILPARWNKAWNEYVRCN